MNTYRVGPEIHTTKQRVKTNSIFRRFSYEFEPTDRPVWRLEGAPSTADMLREIEQIRVQFDNAPLLVRNSLERRQLYMNMIAFVHNSNLGEHVGTQDAGDTEELCEKLLQKMVMEVESVKQRETIQTMKCLQETHKLRQVDTKESDRIWDLYLSPESISNLHEVLMQDLLKGKSARPGGYRKVYAYANGWGFSYSDPTEIENHMFLITDALADKLNGRTSLPLMDLFKLAALVMFNFLDIHPFSDGNGRLARILASHILSLAHFSPVSISPFSDLNGRDVYLDAIQACRDSQDQKPRDLTALLIESSWIAWRRVNSVLNRMVLNNKPLLGCIAIPKFARTKTRREMEAFVFERWITLNHDIRAQKPSQEQLKAEASRALAAFLEITNEKNCPYELDDHSLVLMQE